MEKIDSTNYFNKYLKYKKKYLKFKNKLDGGQPPALIESSKVKATEKKCIGKKRIKLFGTLTAQELVDNYNGCENDTELKFLKTKADKANINPNNLYKNGKGITIENLVKAGYSLEELVKSGITIEVMIKNGFTIKEIREGGISIKEMREGGISINDMRKDFPLIELAKAGYDIDLYELFGEEGISIDDILELDGIEKKINDYIGDMSNLRDKMIKEFKSTISKCKLNEECPEELKKKFNQSFEEYNTNIKKIKFIIDKLLKYNNFKKEYYESTQNEELKGKKFNIKEVEKNIKVFKKNVKSIIENYTRNYIRKFKNDYNKDFKEHVSDDKLFTWFRYGNLMYMVNQVIKVNASYPERFTLELYDTFIDRLREVAKEEKFNLDTSKFFIKVNKKLKKTYDKGEFDKTYDKTNYKMTVILSRDGIRTMREFINNNF